MGLIDKAGKKALLGLPDIKLISLARESMPFISVEADGLSFLFRNTDHSILDYMVENKKIWSGDEMDYIIGYYNNISSRPGAVIDIGANVGTSVIYFRQKFGSNCSYYAVEPVKENYDLLNANCALNGFYDINTIMTGISDSTGEARMEIDPGNMATCRIEGTDNEGLVFRRDDQAYIGGTVPLVTIDSLVSENRIHTDSPLLFWIDVEGHEPEAFRSAMGTFRSADCVVFLEYNPKLYKHNGRYEGFIQDMKECFGRFICCDQIEEGHYAFRDIAEIGKVADENGSAQCDLLLVK